MSARDLARFRARHIEDCLRVLPLVDSLPAGPAIDVGSGVGLPGIPLAICGRARLWRLLEPRRRRAAFLEEAIRVLELEAEVVALSADEAASRPGLRGAHVVATARAVAPPERAFALLEPLVRPGAPRVVFAGRGAKVPRLAGEWAPGLLTIPEMTSQPQDLP
ncbi:MAG: class I SAM-dependent methyltransferase [Actinomycetota bacterium]|nr:class I SAM-dependent methyltransferase [Actinomycetota bacterium]